MPEANICDVGVDNFNPLVLEASKERLVIVDFWAAWCGPCRMLGPILERIASRHREDLWLARIDSDAEPALTARYGVRGLPTVKLFKNRSVAAEFVGARTENEVEAFLAPYLPKPENAEIEAAVAIARNGDLPQAIRRLEALRAKNPEDGEIACHLADLYLTRGEVDTAREIYGALSDSARLADSGRRVAARLGFAEVLAATRAAGGDLLVAAEAGEEPSLYRLASYEVMSGNYEEAARRLLAILRKNPKWEDGRAKTALLDVLTLMGSKSEAAAKLRRRLAQLLY